MVFHASREHRPPRRFSRIGLVDNDVVRMGYELARSSDPAGLVQVGMIARGGHGADDAVTHSARGVRIALADVADNREQVSDVTNWVVTVIDAKGQRELNPQSSYLDSGLSGKLELDWGPREGGGGS